jgi:hypothetical protein
MTSERITAPDAPSFERLGGGSDDAYSLDLPAGADREGEGDQPPEGVQDPTHAHGFLLSSSTDRPYAFHFAPEAMRSVAKVAPETRMRMIF